MGNDTSCDKNTERKFHILPIGYRQKQQMRVARALKIHLYLL